MLSFIIATLNEEKHLDGLLNSLKPQLEKGDEIIVVDSYSKDKTIEIAEKHGAKILTQEKKGIGLAKTYGAEKANNEILIFLDADCTLSPYHAERIRKHFSNPEIIAVGGLDLYESDSGFWGFLYNTFSRFVFYWAKLIYIITKKYWIPANNSVYKKKTFFSVGGFRSVVCEDTDMMRRLPSSKNVIYDSKLIATLSERRFKESGFFRTLILWGWSDLTAVFSRGKSTEGYRKD